MLGQAADRAPVLVIIKYIARTAGIACCSVGFGHIRKPRHNGRGYIVNYRNASVVGGLAGGSSHLQSCQAFLTSPASTVLAEASRGVKIVALMALANLCGLPSLLFTLLLLSIATDFQVVVLLDIIAFQTEIGYPIDLYQHPIVLAVSSFNY